MRMAAATHLYFLSKFIEFLDTFFFIVRKKFRNVSKLQLIHHGVMPIFSFMLVRWLPNGKKCNFLQDNVKWLLEGTKMSLDMTEKF